jgi:hypothetical protein
MRYVGHGACIRNKKTSQVQVVVGIWKDIIKIDIGKLGYIYV